MADKDPVAVPLGGSTRLIADRGLGYEKFPAEKILYIYDKKGNVIGVSCGRFDELPEDVLYLDQPETKAEYRKKLERQYAVLYAGLITYHYTSTSCLLKAAASLNQLLMLFLANPNERRVPIVAGTLLDVYGEIETRTKKPYQFNITLNDDMFKPLPEQILSQFPLSQYKIWKEISKRKIIASVKNKKPAKDDGLIPLVEKADRPVDAKELDKALETATANIKVAAELAQIPPGDTPEVNLYKANLTKITLDDVYNQTKFRNRSGDWKLSELVEVIYYSSYLTIVLDKEGEPFEANGIYGLFRYGMMPQSKKFQTTRFIPPPGNYVSLGPMAGQQFMFKGAIVQKLPIQYNGILGYQERDVTGQWAPDYQEEANQVLGRNKVYMGALIAKNAFSPKDIGITDMIGGLPDVVEDTIPFFLIVVKKKIKGWYENYEDLLKEIVTEVLKNIIIQMLKELAIKYIIKKIGKKVIPVVNAIMAVKDVVDTVRGLDTERDTIAINCVRLYMKGGSQDDKTLSAKILANIMGDEFENEIKAAIIKHASNLGLKLVNKVKGKLSKPESTPSSAESSKALPQPEPEQVPAADVASKPQDKKPNATDTDAIAAGWKAFHETRMEQEKEKERATDHKVTDRPEEVKTGNDAGQKKVHTEEEGKKPEATKPALKAEEKYSEEDRELINRTEKNEESKGAEKKAPPKKGSGGDAGGKKGAGKNSGRQSEDGEEKGKNKNQDKGKKKEKEDGEGSAKSSNVPVKPYPALDVFTNTTQSKFRRKLVAFFKNNPNHPLKAIYNSTTKRLQPSTQKGMDTFYWEEHPEAVQAGHVRSKFTGATDQVIIMTASENQSYSRDMESKGVSINGGFKVAIIEGLPISVVSAQHLISYGKLKQEDLDNAQIVNVNDL
jgi:hypothetical protein